MSTIDVEEFTVTGSTSFDLGARDEKWDGGEAEKSYDLPDDANCYMYRDPAGDASNKSSYKLPFVSKDGGKHAVWGAITAIAQRLSSLKGVSDSDMAAIKKRVETYYAKARKKYSDDSIKAPWEKQTRRRGYGEAHKRALDRLRSQDGEQEFVSALFTQFTDVVVRDPTENPDNTWTFSGYAAVFNQQAIVLDSKWLQLRYEIDPGFFDEVFQSQKFDQPDGVVHFNLNHDMNHVYASTKRSAGLPGSLHLSVDPHGLRFIAKVSRDNPDAVKLAVNMRDGVVDQASMAFLCAADQTTETETEDGPDVVTRRLLSCKQLFDVCATPQGVFSQTISQLQTFAAGIGYPALAGSHQHHPVIDGGARVVSLEGFGGGAGAARRQEIAAMRRSLARIRRS